MYYKGFDPFSWILGIPNGHIFSSSKKKSHNVLTFAARKNILLNWISDESPSLKGWHKIIFELIPLEHLTHGLHKITEHIFKVWTLIWIV